MPGKASRFVGTQRIQAPAARDAARIDRVAATGLAGDHGTLHRPGDRMDLCPRCNPEVDDMLLRGRPLPSPISRTVQKTRLAAKKSPAAKPVVVVAPPKRRGPRPAIAGESRTKLAAVVCTESERRALHEYANSQGMGFAAWAREVLFAAIGDSK